MPPFLLQRIKILCSCARTCPPLRIRIISRQPVTWEPIHIRARPAGQPQAGSYPDDRRPRPAIDRKSRGAHAHKHEHEQEDGVRPLTLAFVVSTISLSSFLSRTVACPRLPCQAKTNGSGLKRPRLPPVPIPWSSRISIPELPPASRSLTASQAPPSFHSPPRLVATFRKLARIWHSLFCSWRAPCRRFSAGAIGWWGSLVVLASSYLWLVFLLQRASSPALVDSRIPSSTLRAPPRSGRESEDSTVSSVNAGV
jgi:hypothetical protein